MARNRRPPQLELEHVLALTDGRRTRPAGPWVKDKLACISAYCRRFTLACTKARGGVYVDAFCGPGMNYIKDTDEYVWGSPMLAARTQPCFNRLMLMDIDPKNVDALRARVGPDRRIYVEAGDANVDFIPFIEPVLSSRAPMFCVLDPQGIELRWSTIKQIARDRAPAQHCELLILFSDRMGFLRLLPEGGNIPKRVVFDMNAFFGCSDWRPIYDAKVRGEISAMEARTAYAELYAKGLKQLGYRTVLPPREVKDRGTEGRLLYQLFFATDDEAGERIMGDILEWMTPSRDQLRLM